MNPFDWTGPNFLIFYAVLAAVATGFLWLMRNRGEKEVTVAAPQLTDPYLVAYLRAGPGEVWRLATVRLIDSGWLEVDGDTVTAVPTAQPSEALNDVERLTLEWFRKPRTAVSLVRQSRSGQFGAAVISYERKLRALRLLPSEHVREANRARYITVVAILALVAVIKILVALDRGHKNVIFLIMMAVLVPIYLYKLAMPADTPRGRKIVEDLEKLFSRLKRPGLLEAGKSSAEVVWMAAVFGVSALSFSHLQKLFPRADAAGAGGSCGSSCGGGGCGGGCGGCGS